MWYIHSTLLDMTDLLPRIQSIRPFLLLIVWRRQVVERDSLKGHDRHLGSFQNLDPTPLGWRYIQSMSLRRCSEVH
jgi:hypothetical protein